MPLNVAVERSDLSGKQSGNAEVEICGGYRRDIGLRLCDGFSLWKIRGRGGAFLFAPGIDEEHSFFRKEREIT